MNEPSNQGNRISTRTRPGFLSSEGSASRNFLYSAIFWLTIADFVGLIAAIEMISPDFLAGIPWLVFGRVRPMHTNGVLFMWLCMAQIGAFFYIVPKLCGVKLHSEMLGNITMVLWNLLGMRRDLTLLNGMTQGREYAELIWPLDVLVHHRPSPGRPTISTAPSWRARRRSSSSASGTSWAR